MDTVKVREDYFNRFTASQYKRRNNKNDMAVLMILLMLFMEYLSNGNEQAINFYAPFIARIKNIDNARAVVNAIEEGLDGRGKLEEEIKQFKITNGRTIRYLTSIIPSMPKPEIKPKGEEKRLSDVRQETAVVEVNNAVSVELNKTMLLKREKTWNTQRDKKVRKTTFHNGIDRQTVGIDDYFRVHDMKAQYPADSELPDWERLGCRCYLTYL